MEYSWRWLRAAIATGVTWGAAWFGVGMAIMLTSLLLTGSTGADVPYPVGFGAIGFGGGLVFSSVLGLLGRSRRLDEITMGRAAGWGAGAGLILSVLFVGIVSLVAEGPGFLSNLPILAGVFGLAGAGCSSGMLALARAAGDDDRLEDARGGAPLLSEGDAPGTTDGG